jgi:Rha family phage regulatory protein
LNIEQKTITSVEVAEMVSKDHNKLLRDIREYIEQLAQSNIGHGNFFSESTYIDSNNQERPCYLVSKKGCEFIAHKIRGIKGSKFTAQYIDKFHDMEEAIKQPKSPIQILELELAAIKEIDNKVETVNKDLQDFKQDMPLLGLECDRITTAVRTKGVNCLGGKDSAAYKDKSLRARVYQDMHHQLKREFGVSTYKAIKRSQTDIALEKVNAYQLPVVLTEAVHDTNNQLTLNTK